ncbi:MAG: hypothetical protein HY720_29185 [Planctomycetes bacterium]|nr:hypothetical protein [Planctomycetota bacterium]
MSAPVARPPLPAKVSPRASEEVDCFEILVLDEEEKDPVRIEAAYRSAKRLWDGRRHNPAFRHVWLAMQEGLARAYETLRDPARRRRYIQERARAKIERAAAAATELAGWSRIAVDSGFLTPEARRGLVGRGVALGLSEATALRVVQEAMLEAGARDGRPPGIDDLAFRRETFRWFVERALPGWWEGDLEPVRREKLDALARQFGFGPWRLAEAIERARETRWWARAAAGIRRGLDNLMGRRPRAVLS